MHLEFHLCLTTNHLLVSSVSLLSSILIIMYQELEGRPRLVQKEDLLRSNEIFKWKVLLIPFNKAYYQTEVLNVDKYSFIFVVDSIILPVIIPPEKSTQWLATVTKLDISKQDMIFKQIYSFYEKKAYSIASKLFITLTKRQLLGGSYSWLLMVICYLQFKCKIIGGIQFFYGSIKFYLFQ